MDVTLPAAYAVGNAVARCAFAFVTARKTARCKQERPDDERNPEAVPVREGVVWMREGDDGALCLWPPLRVQELLPVRRRLRLQRHEAGGREQGDGETLAPPLSPWRSGSRRAVGVILHRDTIDVDATERQRVLGLQSLEEGCETQRQMAFRSSSRALLSRRAGGRAPKARDRSRRSADSDR